MFSVWFTKEEDKKKESVSSIISSKKSFHKSFLFFCAWKQKNGLPSIFIFQEKKAYHQSSFK